MYICIYRCCFFKTSGCLHCWSEVPHLQVLRTPRHCKHLTVPLTGWNQWHKFGMFQSGIHLGVSQKENICSSSGEKAFPFIASRSQEVSSHTVCTIRRKLPVVSILFHKLTLAIVVIYVWCGARGYTKIVCENHHLLAVLLRQKRKYIFFWKIVHSGIICIST